MAQLVISAAAAAIGFTIAGPAGAQWGWMAGSVLGAAVIGQPDVHGPRLADLKVQTSSYGQMLPVLHGTVRCAGNVIWSSDLIEHSKTEEQGGKGGGQDVTTYNYSVHCAVALCEGEIVGIRRIWANGKLIYDRSTTAKITGASPNIRVYTGSETQAVDPLIESYVGVGNTPAYRGTAYVVFEDFGVTDFGNVTPSFSFEVVGSGAGVVPSDRTFGTSCYIAINPNDGTIWSVKGDASVYVYDQRTETLIATLTPGSDSNFYEIVYIPQNKEFWALTDAQAATKTWLIAVFDADSRAFKRSIAPTSYLSNGNALMTCDWSSRVVSYVVSAGGQAQVFFINTDTYAAGSNIAASGNPLLGDSVVIPEHNLTVFGVSFWSTGAVVIDNLTQTVLATWPDSRVGTGTTSLVWVPSARQIWWFAGGHARVLQFRTTWNNDPNAIDVLQDWMALPATITAGVDGGDGYIYALSGSTLYVFDTATQTVVDTLSTSSGAADEMLMSTVTPELIYSVQANTSTPITARPTVRRITTTDVALGDVVSDLCTRSWLTAGDVDVTALTDSVHGYVIASPATIRTNIEALMKAYFFDAVESDNKLKFVKRGGSSVVTIPTDDLAAHAYGAEVPPIIDIQRLEESELPKEVNVAYLDIALDYQTGTQYARRLTGHSNNVVNLQVPVVFTATEAKRIADAQMFAAWCERETVAFATSRKYAKYEPTDVITIDDGNVSRVLRIIDKTEDGAGIINWTAVVQSAAAYSQTSSGVAAAFAGQVLTQDAPTKLLLLDIPVLLDSEDASAGFYVAAAGYGTPWPGCAIFRSTDAGATYTQIASVTTAAVMGGATTALGNFSGGNIFDESNSVTVSLLSGGTLSSVSEALALGGSNAALIGDEIVFFKNATLVSTGIYTLTGLLRGRFGTEWAMGAHAIGDRFVLLTAAGLQRIDTGSGDIALLRHYKAVNFGAALSSASWQSFTNTGRGLMPYAPVQIGGGWNASGDITINWTRRNRTHGAWRDYADVPDTEASESYQVEIYSNNAYTTVKRTITGLTSPTCGYMSAQQIADFGTNVSAVYCKVYQVSTVVGRGIAAVAAIEPNASTQSTKWRIRYTMTGNGPSGTNAGVAEIQMRTVVGGSSVCVGGTATASAGSLGGATPDLAFDGNSTTVWNTSSFTAGDWIQYEFVTPQTIAQYTIQARPTYWNDAPTDFTLQRWDGVTWITVNTQSSLTWSSSEIKTFTV